MQYNRIKAMIIVAPDAVHQGKGRITHLSPSTAAGFGEKQRVRSGSAITGQSPNNVSRRELEGAPRTLMGYAK